jgi:lysozyme
MRLSDRGRTLIKSFEGLSLKAYPDTKKGYSIGYGHFGAKPGDVITREEADRLFDQDVVKYETAVNIATPNTAQHEFDAMTSLAYNIGTAGFATSSVARYHNMGDKQGAADAFRMWKKSDGKDNPVLVARREKERAFYLGSAVTPPGSFPSPPPEQSGPGWPPSIATAPATPNARAFTSASVASLVTLAFGWLVYRLIHR